MLTWALCWLLAEIGGDNGAIFVLTVAGDCIIFFLIACGIKGWPKCH